jgi:choline kinase
MAQSFVDGQDFILAMGDHMASSNLITNVMKFGGDYGGNVLGVDFNLTSYNAHEATRVLVEDKERISSIGKHIRIWNGIDSGVFRFTSEIHEVMNQWIKCDKSGRYELGDMLDYFISQGGLLRSCDISGQFWHDTDSPEDLKHLETSNSQQNTDKDGKRVDN